MLLTTLCYIENADSYLMLHRIKKKADVNKDKWIGIGGKFEKGESPEDCLLGGDRPDTYGLPSPGCAYLHLRSLGIRVHFSLHGHRL